MERTSTILIAEVEAFLERHAMSATRFGLASVNDGHFVRELREGKDIKLSTAEKVIGFMAKHDGMPPASLCRESALKLAPGSRGRQRAASSK
jgi:hypothetical protein